jgi:hypothetical protein
VSRLPGCDKLHVTHAGALRRKYGAAGADAVRETMDALVRPT